MIFVLSNVSNRLDYQPARKIYKNGLLPNYTYSVVKFAFFTLKLLPFDVVCTVHRIAMCILV